MADCPICNRYMLFPQTHACPPEWEVSDAEDDREGDWTVVRAVDAPDAAGAFAERRDDRHGDGPRERTVIVRKKGFEKEVRFDIRFEYSVDYYANEVPA